MHTRVTRPVISLLARPFSSFQLYMSHISQQNRNTQTLGHALAPLKSSNMGKRPGGPASGHKPKKKRLSKRERVVEGAYTREDILECDISAAMSSLRFSRPDGSGEKPEGQEQPPDTKDVPSLPEPGSEVLVEVKWLASTAEGLAVQQGPTRPRLYVVPFAIPGDVARVKVFRHLETHTVADLVSIETPSNLRDGSLIKCQYFGKCGGCQFQMMPYEAQLMHKRHVLAKALANFTKLAPDQIPEVGETVASPMQYGYRTKLTPHYDQPREKGSKVGKKNKVPFSTCPDIGYMMAGRRTLMDIEDCPIGTEAVRKGIRSERERVKQVFGKLTTGATLLVRENTRRFFKNESGQSRTRSLAPHDAVVVETKYYTDYKTFVTDPKADTLEWVGKSVFKNPAGAFFQNNNSILPIVTDYVKDHIAGEKPIKYLIDAYCGSGLFTITLASLLADKANPRSEERSRLSPSPDGSRRPLSPSSRPNAHTACAVGIDISSESIECAIQNAKMSGLPRGSWYFLAAEAGDIFREVKHFRAEDTAVVIDPPRKGCDASFLGQLMEFGPRRIVYVSCNVHTQARDIGMLVRGSLDDGFGDGHRDGADKEDRQDGEKVPENGDRKKRRVKYEIESVRGFDFFPQTSHVEGLAILNRVLL